MGGFLREVGGNENPFVGTKRRMMSCTFLERNGRFCLGAILGQYDGLSQKQTAHIGAVPGRVRLNGFDYGVTARPQRRCCLNVTCLMCVV